MFKSQLGDLFEVKIPIPLEDALAPVLVFELAHFLSALLTPSLGSELKALWI